MDEYIDEPVHFRGAGEGVTEAGYYYRLLPERPLVGPFSTRMSATKDAKWQLTDADKEVKKDG